jgi:hypothetical protein
MFLKEIKKKREDFSRNLMKRSQASFLSPLWQMKIFGLTEFIAKSRVYIMNQIWRTDGPFFSLKRCNIGFFHC